MVRWTFETEVDYQDFSAVFKDPLMSGIVARFGDQADAFLSSAGGQPLPIQADMKKVCGGPDIGVSMVLAKDRRSYTITLESECPAPEMRKLLDTLRYERPDGSGDPLLHYYDTVAPQKPMYTHPNATDRELRERRVLIANNTVEFTRAPFHSNKLPSNVYGKAPRTVFNRVEFFLQHRSWYADKGVPYQLGILLSGQPGAGKTSTIKAVANSARRHIVNVDCKHLVRSDQFKALFFEDELFIAGQSPCRVPIGDRLIVLEEVDQMPCFLQRRFGEVDEPLSNELSISDVLTTLDGARETPGRMFVLTTNHPEVIDRAILRPGRVDVHARFELASADLIRSIYAGLLDADGASLHVPRGVANRLSPALVAQVMLKKAYDAETDITHELQLAAREAARDEDDRRDATGGQSATAEGADKRAAGAVLKKLIGAQGETAAADGQPDAVPLAEVRR